MAPRRTDLRLGALDIMASLSALRLWKDYQSSSPQNHWLGQQFTLLKKYQEMQKLSNYIFDSSLTL